MKWKNLKENKCPKCDTQFGNLAFTKPGYVRCYKCGFAISEKRYTEIVTSQITQELQDKWNKELEGGE